MRLPYGFVKAKIGSSPVLQSKRRPNETQYHLHVKLSFPGGPWDTAINVGTNDDDDSLKFKLVYDFRHGIVATLKAADVGPTDLSEDTSLPALDYFRSDVMSNTGAWKTSGSMDGTMFPEPVASLNRLLEKAMNQKLDVYVFGRFYDSNNGIHDTHMNQGSTKGFINDPRNRRNDKDDRNDIWQDGAGIVDMGDGSWAAYFAAFTQQELPTDGLGNPEDGAHQIGSGLSTAVAV